MKNQILDEPIHDSFYEFLEKGEKILWDDQTRKESFFSMTEIPAIAFFLFVALTVQGFHFPANLALIFSFLIMLSVLIPKHQMRKKQKQTKYVLTPKRIIFQQNKDGELVIDQILLEDIARVFVTVNHFNFRVGDLFLLIKNEKKGLVNTYDFSNGKPDPVPTIKQINNPKEVLKLINEQLNNSTP